MINSFTEITESLYPEVARIYQEGIDTGKATFETNVPSWDTWDASHFPFGRIAIMEKDSMSGWAALTPVSNRCVYGGVAEVSVYVGKNYWGKGIGSRLLTALIEISEENQIWTLQSSVFRNNIPSIKLHEKCGFRVIGYKEKIGKLHGDWYDNVLLEKRSTKIGI